MSIIQRTFIFIFLLISPCLGYSQEVRSMEELLRQMEDMHSEAMKNTPPKYPIAFLQYSVDKNVLKQTFTVDQNGTLIHHLSYYYPFLGMENDIVYVLQMQYQTLSPGTLPELDMLHTLKMKKFGIDDSLSAHPKEVPEKGIIYSSSAFEGKNLRDPEELLTSWKLPKFSRRYLWNTQFTPYFQFPIFPGSVQKLPEMYGTNGQRLAMWEFFENLENFSVDELKDLEHRWPKGGLLDKEKLQVCMEGGSEEITSGIWEEIHLRRLAAMYIKGEETLENVIDFVAARPLPQKIAMTYLFSHIDPENLNVQSSFNAWENWYAAEPPELSRSQRERLLELNEEFRKMRKNALLAETKEVRP